LLHRNQSDCAGTGRSFPRSLPRPIAGGSIQHDAGWWKMLNGAAMFFLSSFLWRWPVFLPLRGLGTRSFSRFSASEDPLDLVSAPPFWARPAPGWSTWPIRRDRTQLKRPRSAPGKHIGLTPFVQHGAGFRPCVNLRKSGCLCGNGVFAYKLLLTPDVARLQFIISPKGGAVTCAASSLPGR